MFEDLIMKWSNNYVKDGINWQDFIHFLEIIMQ